ncbi:MAG TPA: hypothetical protein VKT83_07300 [bacterium]|nr:hypothetical protein [bacterium]
MEKMLYTTADAARRIGLAQEYLVRLCQSEKVPSVSVPGAGGTRRADGHPNHWYLLTPEVVAAAVAFKATGGRFFGGQFIEFLRGEGMSTQSLHRTLLTPTNVRDLLHVPYIVIVDAALRGELPGTVTLSNGQTLFSEEAIAALKIIQASGQLSPHAFRRSQAVRRIRHSSAPVEQVEALVAAASTK